MKYEIGVQMENVLTSFSPIIITYPSKSSTTSAILAITVFLKTYTDFFGLISKSTKHQTIFH